MGGGGGGEVEQNLHHHQASDFSVVIRDDFKFCFSVYMVQDTEHHTLQLGVMV